MVLSVVGVKDSAVLWRLGFRTVEFMAIAGESR